MRIKRGRASNHKVIKPTAQAYGEYRSAKQKEKAELARRRNKFYCKVNSRHKVKSEKFKGITFNFSRPLEYATEISIPLVDGIFTMGGKYSQKLAECAVYVCEQDDDTARTRTARESGIKVITPKELQVMLND